MEKHIDDNKEQDEFNDDNISGDNPVDNEQENGENKIGQTHNTASNQMENSLPKVSSTDAEAPASPISVLPSVASQSSIGSEIDPMDDIIDSIGSTPNGNNANNNHLSTRSEIGDGDRLMRLLMSGGEKDENLSSRAPLLERRLRDFRFAQKKRREKYGKERPWGIIGLYDHLTGIRTDVEWAEDAAWRRDNNEPYLSWADFENAKDTGFNQPFFTYIVMLVCTVCLVVSIGLNGWKFAPLNVNPMIGPSAETLIKMGAKQTSLIVGDKDGEAIPKQWYRLFTPMILHAGIIHYGLNMLALWFVGYAVEQSHGFFASALLFIVPAVGGTILSALFLPEYISVGASGGIFGLIGACVADIVSNWNLLFSKVVNDDEMGTRFQHIKVLLYLFLDILLNAIVGLTPLVDNFTHLGGMVYGFLCGLSTMERLSKAFFGVSTSCWTRFQNGLIRFFGLIVSIVLIIVTVAILFRPDGANVTCKGCRYVSCVPFPFWVDAEDKWWHCDDCELPNIANQANLSFHKETKYFTSVSFNCPDGAIEVVDLEDIQTSDDQWLTKQLPKYCRDYCDEIFSA